MRRVLRYIADNLALIISFGLALAALLTGQYERMEFFVILGMFAVTLNEVHENRAMLVQHMDATRVFIETQTARDTDPTLPR